MYKQNIRVDENGFTTGEKKNTVRTTRVTRNLIAKSRTSSLQRTHFPYIQTNAYNFISPSTCNLFQKNPSDSKLQPPTHNYLWLTSFRKKYNLRMHNSIRLAICETSKELGPFTYHRIFDLNG
jgi:hypothetical protein